MGGLRFCCGRNIPPGTWRGPSGYNLLGKEVMRLASNELRPAGYYNFIWNGMNSTGTKVATGVYLYHAMVRDQNGKTVLNKTKKMVFLK